MYHHDNLTYFDNFEVVKKIIGINKIITNIYRIQANDSSMWEYFCIGFIDFMIKGKSLLDFTDFFSTNKYEKNDKALLEIWN